MKTWWHSIVIRKRDIKEQYRLLEIEKARMNACEIELAKLSNSFGTAYRATWSKMLEAYNSAVKIRSYLRGRDNIYWVLTGKRL